MSDVSCHHECIELVTAVSWTSTTRICQTEIAIGWRMSILSRKKLLCCAQTLKPLIAAVATPCLKEPG